MERNARQERRGGWWRTGLFFCLGNAAEIISCLGLVTTICVVCLNVLLRYCFSRSLSWAEEISVLGFSCVIFIGSAAAYRRHMHVGIDFVVNLLPASLNAVIGHAVAAFLLCFNSYIAWLAWTYSVESWEKPTSILFIPYFFVNIPICIGFALMAGYAARDLLSRLRRHSGTEGRGEDATDGKGGENDGEGRGAAT